MATRIICRAVGCIFNEDKVCTSDEIVYDPEDGCLTYEELDDVIDLDEDDEILLEEEEDLIIEDDDDDFLLDEDLLLDDEDDEDELELVDDEEEWEV